ncbi:hypothetical protein D1872_271630 [compost metagenome]
MHYIMQNILPVIQKFNKLTGSPFIEELINPIRTFILKCYFKTRVQKSDLLKTFSKRIIIESNSVREYTNVRFKSYFRSGSIRISKHFKPCNRLSDMLHTLFIHPVFEAHAMYFTFTINLDLKPLGQRIRY